ncbi:Diphthine synthase [Halorhabdus sp. SVX81]|uniref:diphthine synthase n=1 Tax=Halorhabdus sp. SVX81 TaxID=2978283 RepID=UPI0023D9CE2B|nr:diphthine synthase [Halorhabdus sp. SVX81]WEL17509.1 Diphthine synthase [Halorhabdus sp. SVX81]
MLTFVGLGLYDERSVTLAGRDAIRGADRVFAEFYTSQLAGTTIDALEDFHDIEIEVRDRAGVEQDPDPILAAAASGDAVFLTAGDTMISTTHVDLRLRAEDRGVETRVIHGTTAQAAASSLTGLQNYRFGKATTLPFERSHGGDGVPGSVIETIEANQERGLHTLVFLDITAESDEGTYMRGDGAATLLAEHWRPDALGTVVARAGSADPVIRAGRLADLAEMDFGDPLHLLVVPGSLHYLERDALAAIGDGPAAVLDENTVE